MLGQDLLVSVITLVVGGLIGYGIGKVVKGLLVVIIGVVVLLLLGISFVGLSFMEGLLRNGNLLLRLLDYVLTSLSRYPLLFVGLLIGFIVGLIR